MQRHSARASYGRHVSRLTSDTLAIVMAGGRGERLKGLTATRCKPATPFGGKFRIVDFVLSNCVNSGIRQISILTQYRQQSLIQHVHRGWGYLRGELGEFIEIVPAQQQIGEMWYRGTADALYQNLDLIRARRPKHVLVLAGDHIYKMDYGPMIAYHVEKGADITVGVVQLPASESKHFGVLTATQWHRVTKFTEKPAVPDTIPGQPGEIMASMGIYVFNWQLLEELLQNDARDPGSSHDFGKNIIPQAIASRQVFAYPFQDVKTRAQAYWRDVGTVDAYYEANLELVHVRPELNIYDREWPIWTYQEHQPPAKFILDEDGRRGGATNSMVSGGAILSGSHAHNSLIFSDVRIDERSYVERSVILPHVEIGKGCVIKRTIIDEGCHIPDGMSIGTDLGLDATRFHVTDKGVVLVTADRLYDQQKA